MKTNYKLYTAILGIILQCIVCHYVIVATKGAFILFALALTAYVLIRLFVMAIESLEKPLNWDVLTEQRVGDANEIYMNSKVAIEKYAKLRGSIDISDSETYAMYYEPEDGITPMSMLVVGLRAESSKVFVLGSKGEEIITSLIDRPDLPYIEQAIVKSM